MSDLKLKIADVVNGAPGGRFKKNGENSGEEFYEKYLQPMFQTAQNSGKFLIIDMDDCLGYPSSFLDESFGTLARKYGAKNVWERIVLYSDDQEDLKDGIKSIIFGER